MATKFCSIVAAAFILQASEYAAATQVFATYEFELNGSGGSGYFSVLASPDSGTLLKENVVDFMWTIPSVGTIDRNALQYFSATPWSIDGLVTPALFQFALFGTTDLEGNVCSPCEASDQGWWVNAFNSDGDVIKNLEGEGLQEYQLSRTAISVVPVPASSIFAASAIAILLPLRRRLANHRDPS